jgi:DNA mismatch repair protein MutS
MIIDDYINYEIEYRKKYGEKTLILIQVGSFFELYSVNENCSFMNKIGDICNIQISRKNKAIREVGKNNPLMAGFPLYALQKFIQILLNHQFTIVLIEQTTPPPNPQRKITEIISPSTNINNNIRNGNYIIVYYFEEVNGFLNVGISGVDLTTGKSFVYENGSNRKDPQLTLDECYRILSAYNPTEVLIISDVIKDEYKNKINDIININCLIHRKFEDYELLSFMKKIDYQKKILEKAFKNTSMLSIIEFLNLEKMTIGILSFCSLLQFAYEHNADIIKELNIPEILEKSNKLLLEYNSAIQLNLISYNSNDKTLMEILNRTSTAFGSRGFKERLLNPINDRNELNRRYEKIEELLKDNKFKLVIKKLNNINDLERTKRKILLKKINPHEWNGFINSLEYAIEAFDILDIKNETSLLIQSFSHLNLDECSKYNINDIKSNIFKEGYSNEIDELMEDYKNQLKKLDEIVDKISRIDDTSCKLDYNEKDGYFISITKKRFETAIKKDKSFMTKFDKRLTTNNNSYKLTSADINEASTIIERRQDEISKKVILKYQEFLSNISKNQIDILIKIIDELTELDISCCNARNAFDFCYYRPIIKDGGSYLNAENLRHPIIERLMTNVEYIGNDINLNQDGILLYGINSSGKSSLMKAVGLSIIMSQSGMYVPATSFEFSPYNHIFTRICGNDDIYRGMSSFVVEMTELRNILQRADENSLVIGDEICCGTEITSAIAIVSSAINELIKKKSSFIFTSHLHELPTISIIKDKNLRIYHIHIEIVDDKIIYERKLKEGQGSNIYGIDVCGSLDMPNDFMKNAEIVRKEITGLDVNLMNTKKSNYKSSIFMDMCQVCNEKPAKETHHINYQINADDNGKFSNFDKNTPHNLINVCEECHLKEHKGEIGIIGYKQTSKGIIIDIDKTARIYKLIKRGRNGWFMRKKINDKFKAVEEKDLIDFYNKQMKSGIKEISVEMERDFFDISL